MRLSKTEVLRDNSPRQITKALYSEGPAAHKKNAMMMVLATVMIAMTL